MVAIQTKVFLLPTPLYPCCHTPAGSLSAFEPLAHLAMCCMPGTPTAKLGLFLPLDSACLWVCSVLHMFLLGHAVCFLFLELLGCVYTAIFYIYIFLEIS